MLINADQIVSYVAAGLWPFARITGLCMVAPVFGGRLVPARVRILFAAVLTVALVPLMEPVPPADVMSLAGVFTVARELIVGLALGFVVQMVFDALVIAGQTISLSMGLAYATMVDPSRGSVPVLGQFYIVTATLLFLSLNAHLALLRILADSFQVLPAGAAALAPGDAWSLVAFGTSMFAGALQIALPAVASLLIVNIAFGVISRASPSLNLFAVGFPVALLMGFVILARSIDGLAPAFSALLDEATRLVSTVFLGG